MNMKLKLLVSLQILLSVTVLYPQIIAIPDGYAAYAETTGGGNVTPITVTTPEQFKSAVNNNNPAVIIVVGKLDMRERIVRIGSNKTIIGANETSGLYGGEILLRRSNYIFQNLIIGPNPKGNAMRLLGATKVFLHKCEFYDGANKNLNIVVGSDYVTVSWCKFYYVNQTIHKLSTLIGNSDHVPEDVGKLHVTMHHNWFAENCRSRMPRVRYGHVHIYNNYYNSVGNMYCIGTGHKCHIRVENSYFEKIRKPWTNFGATTSGGVMGWNNLKFVNCSQPTYIDNSYPVFEVPYTYDMDPVDDVKTIVREGAGNVFS